jgi:hypothetical protein
MHIHLTRLQTFDNFTIAILQLQFYSATNLQFTSAILQVLLAQQQGKCLLLFCHFFKLQFKVNQARLGAIYLTLGIFCGSNGQPASLWRKIVSSHT